MRRDGGRAAPPTATRHGSLSAPDRQADEAVIQDARSCASHGSGSQSPVSDTAGLDLRQREQFAHCGRRTQVGLGNQLHSVSSGSVEWIASFSRNLWIDALGHRRVDADCPALSNHCPTERCPIVFDRFISPRSCAFWGSVSSLSKREGAGDIASTLCCRAFSSSSRA